MEELAGRLAEANAELSMLTRIDPLTKLLNRRAWQELASQEYEKYERHGTPYSVVMLDVDHFKRFNDARGHQAGDECLHRVGRCITETCRSIDHVGRYGGEEFIVLAPGTDDGQAKVLAERIRDAIWNLNLPHPDSPTADRVTLSAGIAITRGEAWEKVVRRADEALYAAKERGRNMVVCDGEATTPPSDHVGTPASSGETVSPDQP